MNTEVFAEWLRRRGHRVIQTESSYWYDAGPRVYQAFPYGWIIQPSEKELHQLTWGHGALALRYSTPVTSPEGKISYHVVLNRPYNLDVLNNKARNSVRAGLKNCRVERITFKKMAEDGWNLQKNTLERQVRSDSMSQSEWEKLCFTAQDLPGFEAWGAMVDGDLAGTLFTVRINDTYYVPYAQSLKKYLPLHINNAIFYVAACEMLAQAGINGIFFSLDSLDAPESTNEFKFRMNFKVIPVRQRVVFHPGLALLANKASYQILSGLTHRFPANNFFSKAEGMSRFYLEGKRPLAEQEWPKCTSEFRDQYVAPAAFEPQKEFEQA
jgi:hypothetical protein